MEWVDTVLHDFDGQLTYTDILNMTYKELGYLHAHRKANFPVEADQIARSLLGMTGGKAAPKAPPPPSGGRQQRPK